MYFCIPLLILQSAVLARIAALPQIADGACGMLLVLFHAA